MNKHIFSLLVLFAFAPFSLNAGQCDDVISCVKVPDICKDDCDNDCGYNKTFFSYRPQDSNSAPRIIRITQEKHGESKDTILWGVDFTLGAQQTFGKTGQNLGEWFLFNGSSCGTVGIPSDTETYTIDGHQIGLVTPGEIAGKIGNFSLDPSIKNVIFNVNTWFNLDKHMSGLWLRANTTLVRTKRSLGFASQTSNAAQSGSYASGEFTLTCSPADIAYHSVQEALIGDKPFGDVPALQFGKFFCGDLSKTAFASVRVDLGFDAIRSDDALLNIGACFYAPTGNRPHAEYLFEPIIGANRSWQLGAFASGAYHFNENDFCNCSLYFDATLTHLFKSTQTRLFNLRANGAGSQYLLLKVLDTNLGLGAVINADRVANILAGEAKIGAKAMLDSSLMLHMKHKQFFFDLGYNFWLRSHETLGEEVCFLNFETNTYGIKGDLPLSKVVSGFCIGDVTTASTSTISKPGIADAETVTLNVCDINFNAPLHPTAFSNKVFGAIGYNTESFCHKYDMYIALEGEAEFGNDHKAVNQWAVNVILGLAL